MKDGVLVAHRTKSGKVRRVPLPAALVAELRMKVDRLLPIQNAEGFARYCQLRPDVGTLV